MPILGILLDTPSAVPLPNVGVGVLSSETRSAKCVFFLGNIRIKYI